MKFNRLKFIQFIFLFVIGIILYKSAKVQLFPDKRLIKNQEQFYNAEIIRVANRGSIFDRHDNALAISINSFSLYTHPKLVKHPKKAAKVLSKTLGLPRRKILKQLNSDKPFVWIKRKLSEDLKQQIESHKLEGIGFLKEPDRVYPNEQLGAHILGFTDVDLKGLHGIELKYDKALEGIPRSIQVLKDARGRIIYVGESASSTSRAGYNLTLSIDKNIQYTLEVELKKIIETFSAKSAVAIAMDPRSGEILALGIEPSFNPNKLNQEMLKHTRNRLISDMYEPGSTMKAVTIAAALEYKISQPDDLFDCENGKLRIGRHLITDTHAHEILPLHEILKVSSNICTIKVANALGKNRLDKFLKTLGFGSLTEIDLPGEIRGSIPKLSEWKDINLATISYGHGIAVTPIQLLRAYSAIANGGLLVRPHVLLKVEDEFGNLIYENSNFQKKRVFSTTVSDQLRQMLLKVTEEGGTATMATPFGFAIPGKTGTAIKYDEDEGGYKQGAYMSSFIGMFPPASPRVLLLIIVDEPQDRFYGGSVAGPAFKNVSEKIISLLSLYPQLKLASHKQVRPRINDKSQLKKSVSTIKQMVAKDTIMPELKGLSLSQVQEMLRYRGWLFKYKGVGHVVSQHPLSGMSISDKTEIQVVLKP